MLKEISKEAVEGVRMESGWEYIPEGKQNPRAAELYTMTEEERKNIPMKHLVTECYLARFGYLGSFSMVDK